MNAHLKLWEVKVLSLNWSTVKKSVQFKMLWNDIKDAIRLSMIWYWKWSLLDFLLIDGLIILSTTVFWCNSAVSPQRAAGHVLHRDLQLGRRNQPKDQTGMTQEQISDFSVCGFCMWSVRNFFPGQKYRPYKHYKTYNKIRFRFSICNRGGSSMLRCY